MFPTKLVASHGPSHLRTGVVFCGNQVWIIAAKCDVSGQLTLSDLKGVPVIPLLSHLCIVVSTSTPPPSSTCAPPLTSSDPSPDPSHPQILPRPTAMAMHTESSSLEALAAQATSSLEALREAEEVNRRNELEVQAAVDEILLMHREHQPKNTKQAYGPKQKEWQVGRGPFHLNISHHIIFYVGLVQAPKLLTRGGNTSHTIGWTRGSSSSSFTRRW